LNNLAVDSREGDDAVKKWIVGLGAVIGLLLIFALTVPFVVPKDTVKEQIVAQLQAATGWRLRIDGDINISALPFLKLNAKDVGVSGEAGADGLEFVTVREIRFGLSLLSLLSGVVEVTGVTLVEPNLFLETDAAGRTSWEPRRDVATAATPAEPVPAEAEAEAETEQAESPGATLALLDRLRFGALEIRDGIAVWDDRRANQKHTISKINVTARMPSLRDAARVDGSVTWNDIAVAFDLKAGDPLALTEGRQSEITGSVSAAGSGTGL